MSEVSIRIREQSVTANKKSAATGRLLWPPSIMLWLFAAVPFALLIVASVSHNIQDASWQLGFEFTHYQRLAQTYYLNILIYSIGLSMLVACIVVVIAFPFAYLISRLSYRSQVIWLVFLLTGLSLSEVLIAFSWQVLLTRTIGLSNILVWLGLLERSVSLQPGFGAMLVALVYAVMPFAFLLLYPPLSRLDRSLTEAARTMGASPLRAFFSVVIPVNKIPLIGSLILMFIFVLGAYVTPTQLGKPAHWTLSVHIADQAQSAFNVPFASALAMVLMLVSLTLVLMTIRLGKHKHQDKP